MDEFWDVQPLNEEVARLLESEDEDDILLANTIMRKQEIIRDQHLIREMNRQQDVWTYWLGEFGDIYRFKRLK